MSKTVKRGRCPSCQKEPRIIAFVDPVTRANICRTCYRKAQAKNPELVMSEKRLVGRSTTSSLPVPRRAAGPKINICPECDKGPKKLLYRHPETGQNICQACYQRIKRQNARKTFRPAPVIRGRKEKAKKPGRKARYPAREAAIEALEAREVQEKENFPNVLGVEDSPLYYAALRFGVELPSKKNPPVRYYPEDLVKNQNSKDPDICDKVGKVVSANERVTRVDFSEAGRVIRVYKKWLNINHIVLSVRKTRRSVKKLPENKALA